MMFDALIKQNPDISLPQDHVDFVKDLIRGRARLTKEEKPFLFQIVANAENGLDVDKCFIFGLLQSKYKLIGLMFSLTGLIILLGMLIIVVCDFVMLLSYPSISISPRSEAWCHNITVSVHLRV